MLDGKVILVTGGARRLGAAIVEFAAGLGARTAIHYGSSAEDAERVAGTVTSNGGEAVVFQADLSDADAAQQLPGVVAEEMGGLDVLVNSAGILVKQPFGSVTAADWDRVFDINLRAYFFTAQGAAPMLRASRGSIINISDVAAFDAWVGFGPWSRTGGPTALRSSSSRASRAALGPSSSSTRSSTARPRSPSMPLDTRPSPTRTVTAAWPCSWPAGTARPGR